MSESRVAKISSGVSALQHRHILLCLTMRFVHGQITAFTLKCGRFQTAHLNSNENYVKTPNKIA